MDLIKANYDDISWGQEGKLYRGTFQAALEQRFLKSFFESNELSYYGYNFNCADGKMTSFSVDFIDAVIYSCQRDPDRIFQNIIDGKPSLWPFTRYPLIIEVNAKNYKNNLYYGLEHKEIVVTGPIDAKDIKIIFSAEIDRFSKIPKKTQGRIRYVLDKTLIDKNFSKEHSLLKYLINEKNDVLGALNAVVFGMRPLMIGGEFSKLETSIEFLKKKLIKK